MKISGEKSDAFEGKINCMNGSLPKMSTSYLNANNILKNILNYFMFDDENDDNNDLKISSLEEPIIKGNNEDDILSNFYVGADQIAEFDFNNAIIKLISNSVQMDKLEISKLLTSCIRYLRIYQIPEIDDKIILDLIPILLALLNSNHTRVKLLTLTLLQTFTEINRNDPRIKILLK